MSEFNMVDFWYIVLEAFNCIQIYWNDEIVWDDNVDIENWKCPEDAFQKWQKRNPNCRKYMVENINIEMIEFHHGIVRMYGREIK